MMPQLMDPSDALLYLEIMSRWMSFMQQMAGNSGFTSWGIDDQFYTDSYPTWGGRCGYQLNALYTDLMENLRDVSYVMHRLAMLWTTGCDRTRMNMSEYENFFIQWMSDGCNIEKS
jgi:hypothetical protein